MRWLPIALVLASACPRPATTERPAFTVGEAVLRHAIDTHHERVYDVVLDHGSTTSQSAWTLGVAPLPEEATVTLTSDAGTVYTFIGNGTGRTRTGGTSFSERLIRQLVWVRLPRAPASIGASWEDPQWAEPFLSLLPAGTADHIEGRSELVSLVRTADGVEAVVDSIARIDIAGRTVLDARARAVFDVGAGVVVERDATARFYTPEGPDVLHIALTQTGGLGTPPGGRR